MGEFTIVVPNWIIAWFLGAFALLMTLEVVLKGLKLYERYLKRRSPHA